LIERGQILINKWISKQEMQVSLNVPKIFNIV